MVGNEQVSKPEIITYEPGPGRRLLLWFGVYFVPQVPLFGLLPYFWLFPSGLKYWFEHKEATSTPGGCHFYVWYCGFYILHLCTSLAVPGKKIFRALLILLAVVVILNVAGCMETNPDLRGLN